MLQPLLGQRQQVVSGLQGRGGGAEVALAGGEGEHGLLGLGVHGKPARLPELGGHEHFHQPLPRQIVVAQGLQDSGAIATQAQPHGRDLIGVGVLAHKGLPGGVGAHGGVVLARVMQVPAKQQLRGAQQGRFGIAGLQGFAQALGQGGDAQPHFARAHPVARGDGASGVLLFGQGEVAAVAAWRVGGPAVIKLVDELGFVQGQAVGGGFVLEQAAVVRHVKHGGERNAPRVDLGRHQFGLLALRGPHGFADEHRRGAVELFGQFGVAVAAEHRAGERVGVDEAELVGREGEAAARVGQLGDLAGIADKLCRLGLAQRKQAELEAAVYRGKQGITVFNVVQADQPPALRDVAKVGFGAVVGGNAGGHDKARPARGRGDLQHGFGKQGVGVDVAHARERVAPALAAIDVHEHAAGLCRAPGVDEFGVQALFGLAFAAQRRMAGVAGQLLRQRAQAQGLDVAAALGLVAGVGHRRVAGGKKFFFLQLDALPWRVAQHAVKAAGGKHLGKGQRPVQHARLLAGGAGGGHGGVLRVGGVVQPVRGRQRQVQRLAGGYQRGGVGGFGQQVGTYSQIGRQGKRAVR